MVLLEPEGWTCGRCWAGTQWQSPGSWQATSQWPGKKSPEAMRQPNRIDLCSFALKCYKKVFTFCLTPAHLVEAPKIVKFPVLQAGPRCDSGSDGNVNRLLHQLLMMKYSYSYLLSLIPCFLFWDSSIGDLLADWASITLPQSTPRRDLWP